MSDVTPDETEIEDGAANSGAFRAFEQTQGVFAALHHLRLVAEAPKHCVNQPPLDRIVVDNEHTRGHNPSRRAKPVPWRGLCGTAVNGI